MPKSAPSKISVDELNRKLADLSVPEEELAKYFEADEERSTPTRPVLKLNEKTVQVPPASDAQGRARSAALLNSANFISRLRREARFNAVVAGGEYKGPLIAAEGDSWFQYPIILKDVIDHVFDDYAVYCRSEAGDTLENMVRRGEYLDALERTGGQLLLLSGGGNDLVAGGNLAEHLRDFDRSLAPAEHLLPSFDGILNSAIANIERIVRDVGRAFPNAAVICHGYDYTIPANGKWLGKPMKKRGISDTKIQKAIAEEMVNRFNTRLRAFATQAPRVTYVDCRNAVGDSRWHDELHPTDEGYGAVAKRVKDEIKRVASGLAAGPTPPAGPGPSARARSRAREATRPEAAVAKGYSLHVGLNLVDPGHYEGWDGALTACEFDANDMADLARAIGYDAQVLLTKAATRMAVTKMIGDAAKKMRPGDIFLLSYSGHGGQVPDYSGDEAADRPDDFTDETLCLFDGQLIDDELYTLWAKFPAGSRVVVLSDCCHSGSNIKARMIDDMLSASPAPDRRPRVMPLAVSARVARRNRAFYRDVASKAAAVWVGGPATREMALPIGASVRLISACQDNQVALDGLTNGLFTGRLLETWGDGAFRGNYGAFHQKILDRMPPDQTPNHYGVGQRSAAFDAQRPFDI